MIFDDSPSEVNQSSREISNNFILSEDQRANINKRLPRGFMLIKAIDIPTTHKFAGEI